MARFRRIRRLSAWRRISLHAWSRPNDPTAYGMLEIDIENARLYIQELTSTSGVKVSLTHLVGKAVANAIAERPEVNAIVRRGRRIYQRDSIDVFFQVAFEGGEDLSGAKIEAADGKSVLVIARELQMRAERVRANRDRDFTRSSQRIAALPSFLRGCVLRTAEYLSYDLGLDLSVFGIPYDAFGSVMVTNVGTFGLPRGFAPLVPFSRAPIVLTIGAVEPRPWVVGRDKLRVRDVLSVGVALDHRLLDGYQAGRIARRFREILEDPAVALGSA
jgi:pyruvate/2-oxoglutarate dehydrogenase complex dihydrolipoamide acyltransferase (E2) component